MISKVNATYAALVFIYYNKEMICQISHAWEDII
jgi:hypothetical protein